MDTFHMPSSLEGLSDPFKAHVQSDCLFFDASIHLRIKFPPIKSCSTGRLSDRIAGRFRVASFLVPKLCCFDQLCELTVYLLLDR